jgi:acetyl-CoA carboxylase beta subunit
MTVYWASTKAPVHLFRREYESVETAEHLKEHSFVDAAVLADELRISEMSVRAYQRRLKLRRITTRKDYK